MMPSRLLFSTCAVHFNLVTAQDGCDETSMIQGLTHSVPVIVPPPYPQPASEFCCEGHGIEECERCKCCTAQQFGADVCNDDYGILSISLSGPLSDYTQTDLPPEFTWLNENTCQRHIYPPPECCSAWGEGEGSTQCGLGSLIPFAMGGGPTTDYTQVANSPNYKWYGNSCFRMDSFCCDGPALGCVACHREQAADSLQYKLVHPKKVKVNENHRCEHKIGNAGELTKNQCAKACFRFIDGINTITGLTRDTTPVCTHFDWKPTSGNTNKGKCRLCDTSGNLYGGLSLADEDGSILGSQLELVNTVQKNGWSVHRLTVAAVSVP